MEPKSKQLAQFPDRGIKVMLMMPTALLISVQQANADAIFEDESNPHLPLCKEFKAYIERHADKPIYCDLIPDKQFIGFTLPQLDPAPEGLGLRIDIQSSLIQFEPNRSKWPYKFEDYQKALDVAKKNAPTKRYKTVRLDINHDGEEDNLLLSTHSSLCKEKGLGFHRLTPFADHMNIASDYISSSGYAGLSGQPFLYKGRAYVVDSSKRSFSVFEPRQYSRGGQKVKSGRPICRYWRKV